MLGFYGFFQTKSIKEGDARGVLHEGKVKDLTVSTDKVCGLVREIFGRGLTGKQSLVGKLIGIGKSSLG